LKDRAGEGRKNGTTNGRRVGAGGMRDQEEREEPPRMKAGKGGK